MKKYFALFVVFVVMTFAGCENSGTIDLSCEKSPIHPYLYNPSLSGGWYLFSPKRGEIIDGFEWEKAGYVNLLLQTEGVNNHYYYVEINKPYRFGNLRVSDPKTNKAHSIVFEPGGFMYGGKSFSEDMKEKYYCHFRISWVVWPAKQLTKENIVALILRPKNKEKLPPLVLKVKFYNKKAKKYSTIFNDDLKTLPGWYPSTKDKD